MPDIDPASPVLCFGPFRLDEANARLMRGEQALEIWPKDLDVLCYLVRRPGRLVTKDELLDAVWKQRFISESVLKSVVSRLRTLLGDAAKQPSYIETAQRRGYRFIAEVRQESGRTHAAPSPVLASSPVGSALVGRETALNWLREQLAIAASGRIHLAWLAGEAGIGKSSLISNFTQHIAGSAPVWLACGQCVEHAGTVEPYLPMLEALSGLCKAQPEAGLVALMRQVAPTWLVQLPWFMTADDRQHLLAEVAGATRERMLRECGELLDSITALQPLVVVIEDLHWSDPATLQLLGYLARRQGSARALLLSSLRPAELMAAEHPLKALRHALRQQRLGAELELSPFSVQDTATYLRRHAPDAAWPEALARALQEHTGGLPLFTAAIVDEFAAEVEPSLHRIHEIPASLFGLIEQQHARLPELSQRWLEAASVAGVEFAHLPLADALGAEPDRLQQVFDLIVRAGGCLRESGVNLFPDGRLSARYAFRHAIYQQVLYALTGSAQRVQTHRRIAAALQQAYGPEAEVLAAELAMHFEKGQEPAQAVRQLSVAAQRALRRFAPAEAATIARHGLSLLETLSERTSLRDTAIELQVSLGVATTALQGATSPESGRAFAEAAELLGELQPTPARIAALHGIWWSMLSKARLARAQEMAAQVLALAERRDDLQLSFAGHSAMGITLTHIGDMARARQHLTQALEQLDSAALPEAMFAFEPGVQLMSCLSMALWSLGLQSEAAEQIRLALARAEALKHPLSLLLAQQAAALHQGMAGKHQEQLALSDSALQAAAEQGLSRGTGMLSWLKGRAQVALGDIEGGLALMRQGRELQQAHGQMQGLTRWH